MRIKIAKNIDIWRHFANEWMSTHQSFRKAVLSESISDPMLIPEHVFIDNVPSLTRKNAVVTHACNVIDMMIRQGRIECETRRITRPDAAPCLAATSEFTVIVDGLGVFRVRPVNSECFGPGESLHVVTYEGSEPLIETPTHVRV